VVVRKEDQRTMDTTLRIEQIGTECSICIRVKQIHPTTSSLRHVARLMGSLHGLINEIHQQHSPKLRSFAINEVNLTGYTDEHNMLQAVITLKQQIRVEIGLDQITGLTLAFFPEEL